MTLTGIYLLLALGGSELGMKQMATMEECRVQAQHYAAQKRFTTIQCLENPIIGSARAPPVRTNAIRPSEIFDFISGMVRRLEQEQ